MKQCHRFNQLAIGKEISCCLGMGTNILYSSCSLLGQAHKDESLVANSLIGDFIKKANGFVSTFPCSKGFILGFWTKCNACYIFFMFVGVPFMLPHVVSFIPRLFGKKKSGMLIFIIAQWMWMIPSWCLYCDEKLYRAHTISLLISILIYIKK